MTDTGMVEKVARAIATSLWQTRGGVEEQALDAYDLINNNGRFECDCAARAAIPAMEVPSEAMEVAGGLKCEAIMFEENAAGVIFKDMGLVYRAMIQAALKEQG